MSHGPKPPPRPTFRDTDARLPVGAARQKVDRVLRDLHPGASWNDVRRLVETGKVSVDGVVVRDPQAWVIGGARLTLRMSSPRPHTGLLGPDAIAFIDHHVVVVRKPAGIATVPFEDERDTLDRLVHALVRKAAQGGSVAPLGVVQRLDKDTSGLLVFARSSLAKQSLQQQLREHTVHRRYVALAHGQVEARTLRSHLVKDRGDGYRGSTDDRELGREAVTHVSPLESLRGATLVECRLETGRTHQIRIHLSEAGHPLLGEPVYARRYPGPLLRAPRLMLHAAELGFVHPKTGKDLFFEEPPPPDFATVLESLRV